MIGSIISVQVQQLSASKIYENSYELKRHIKTQCSPFPKKWLYAGPGNWPQ